MLQLKYIVRNIIKYRFSAGLTLLSLSLSFLAFIILSLYITHEKSYDKFHKNASSIYRLHNTFGNTNFPSPVKGLLSQNIPEVKNLTLFAHHHKWISKTKAGKRIYKSKHPVIYADTSFLRVFTFPLTQGSKEEVLNNPNTIILTETLSKKLFGKKSPLNESVQIDGEMFEVTGVMNDFPINSSFSADCIASLSTLHKDHNSGIKDWNSWSYPVFLELLPGSNPENVAEKIEQIPIIRDKISLMKSKFPNQPFISLQPLRKIHFIPGSYQFKNGDNITLFILSTLALVILIMGAANYINFYTAQAPLRTKSISVSQVLGEKRHSSIIMIISETTLISLAAMTFALCAYFFVYPFIETTFYVEGISMSERYHFIAFYLLFSLGFSLATSIFPARYITSSPLASSVKGNFQFKGKRKAARYALITLQFIFTMVMLISALFINRQLSFWYNFNIGINKDHVVHFRTTSKMRSNYASFANELMKNPNITDYTYTEFIPGTVGMSWGREVDGEHIQIVSWAVDNRFMDFFGLKIADGRKFTNNSNADINSFVINQKAVDEFEWDNPMEKEIRGFDFTGQIIGVVENFNFASLKEDVKPMLLWLTKNRKNTLLLRISPGNYTQCLEYIRSTCLKYDPDCQIEISFLDETLNILYKNEESTARFIKLVALWCIILSATGLSGLIVFICREHVKEIGIRKVNGAKTKEIIIMLNKHLLKWVILAFCFSLPTSWYLLRKWLENFAYRVNLDWWVFFISGLIMLCTCLLLVTWQSWKAASRNPVDSLRYE